MKTITLAAPGKNALSVDLMRRTLASVRDAGDAPILLTGEGNAFSAGLNLKEVVSLDEDGMRAFLGVLEELVAALYEHPGPTLAWVNGHAIAGGCVLALTCDLRVMTTDEGARIGLNETAIGLEFPPRTFAMTRRRVPVASHERVLLDAQLHDPKAALGLGLVDFLGTEADAKAHLERLAAHPRAAYAATKRAIRGTLEVSPEDMRDFETKTVPKWVAPELKTRLAGLLVKK